MAAIGERCAAAMPASLASLTGCGSVCSSSWNMESLIGTGLGSLSSFETLVLCWSVS
jgi:predicted branched-subunit amino acid permease